MSDFVESVKSCLCRLHDINHVDIIETHISWVFLTGEYAYKVKKPVDYGFVNFTTLEKRRFYCHEEYRLNKRLASELYIDVVTLTGVESYIEINGRLPVVDYAVRLYQFKHDHKFDVLLNQLKLRDEDFDALATRIATFHNNIDIAPPSSRYGEPNLVHTAVTENFFHCRQSPTSHAAQEKLDRVSKWCNSEIKRIYPSLLERKNSGMVRECHGDLHLGNICIFRDKITPFDCIEFNANFRWIDVINEIAFLVMDLMSLGRQDFAMRFLNEYLTITGDYSGLNCLRYYLVYRAMVRAKIEHIRARQGHWEESAQQTAMSNFNHYIELADSLTNTTQPLLLITHGLTASGKSTLARQLQKLLFVIHIRSDVERKRLYGLEATANSHSTINTGIYTSMANLHTYQRLYEIAESLIKNHWSVVVDATFLQHKSRKKFLELANRYQAHYVILNCATKQSDLQQRLVHRSLEPYSVSEADLAVLQQQITAIEPLTDQEQLYTVTIDTNKPIEINTLAEKLRVTMPD